MKTNRPFKNPAQVLCLVFLLLLSTHLLKAQSTPMSVQVITTPSCDNDGTAQFNITGGTAPYSFNLFGTDVFPNPTLTELYPATYTISITDADGQTIQQPFTIDPVLTVSKSMTPETCKSDGTASVAVSGGASPYAYQWNYMFPYHSGNPVISTNASVTGLNKSDLMTIKVTDANGCTALDSIWIESDYTVQTSVAVSATACNSSTNATVTASGGQAPYTYYWNSNPVQTSAVATLSNVGTYNVTVTDANGCIGKDQVTIGNTDLNYLGLTTSHTNANNCNSADGTASVTATQGQSPYTYLWSNGATSASVSGLVRGTYTAVVTDANGCKSSDTVHVGNSTDLSIYFSSSSPSCTDGSGIISTYVDGGLAPYTYSWTNGGTTETISNLNWGNYELTVTDAQGCSKTKATGVYQDISCSNVFITGTVFNDINGNCLQEAGENGIANTMVFLSNGLITWTGIDGAYLFVTSPGSYTISHTPLDNWINICPASHTISVNAPNLGDTYSNNNFSDQVQPGKEDLAVNLWCFSMIPGYGGSTGIYYVNNGSSVQSGTISLTHSSIVTFGNAYPNADSYNPTNQTAEWSFTNLNPGESRVISVQFNVDPSVPLGTLVPMSGFVTPVTGEVLISNNYDTCNSVVIGSYDPNEIAVAPQGATDEGYINPADSVLHYIIHFQNTGTAPAYKVVLTDTLSQYLDPHSIADVSSSSNVLVEEYNGTLRFTFNNINLPDSISDAENSIGFVTFSIKVKKSTPLGVSILNKANVYFDFNSPVTTNTVKNTLKLSATTAVRNEVYKEEPLQAFPNPTSGMLTILYKLDSNTDVALKLYSPIGEEISVATHTSQNAGTYSVSFDTQKNGLTAGVYILKLFSGEQIQYKKIVITD
ncbi:MAG TPA: T9SS type A sorting domain-containing protein [Cytophagaceae bacterium]|nr:T9SS type A sorting domain-containing protein [Cytophagaceae bacterium]